MPRIDFSIKTKFYIKLAVWAVHPSDHLHRNKAQQEPLWDKWKKIWNFFSQQKILSINEHQLMDMWTVLYLDLWLCHFLKPKLLFFISQGAPRLLKLKKSWRHREPSRSYSVTVGNPLNWRIGLIQDINNCYRTKISIAQHKLTNPVAERYRRQNNHLLTLRLSFIGFIIVFAMTQ